MCPEGSSGSDCSGSIYLDIHRDMNIGLLFADIVVISSTRSFALVTPLYLGFVRNTGIGRVYELPMCEYGLGNRKLARFGHSILLAAVNGISRIGTGNCNGTRAYD